MDALQILEHARKLLAAHGDRAEAEAAQKATALDADGDAEQADVWRKIRAAIHEMRDGHQA